MYSMLSSVLKQILWYAGQVALLQTSRDGAVRNKATVTN